MWLVKEYRPAGLFVNGRPGPSKWCSPSVVAAATGSHLGWLCVLRLVRAADADPELRGTLNSVHVSHSTARLGN